MRTKVTLLLLVLVAGLGTLTYYMARWNLDKPIEETTAQILGPDAIDLDYIKIEFRDPARTTVLEKKNGSWEITEPIHWPAYFFAVSRLLSQLQFLARENSFDVPGGADQPQLLAQYGLAPPEGTVTFGRHGARHVLQIGKITDNGTNLYVRRERGQRIFVVKRALRDSLELPLDKMRSVEVFTLRVDEVTSWNVQLGEAGNLRVFLTRDGDKWTLDAAVRTRADKTKVETLLGEILKLQIDSFEPGNGADRNAVGLVTPAFRIKVERYGQPETLLIGSAVPGDTPNRYYASRDDKGPVFTIKVSDNFIKDLRESQLGLRERRVLDFDPAKLQSITVTAIGQPPITLQKLENGQWQVVSTGLLTAPGDTEKINALVTELSELRAVSQGGFVTDAPSEEDLDRKYGLSRGATWQVAVNERKDSGETSKQTLLLGKADEANPNQIYAKLDETKFVYRVDRGIADDLSSKPFEYRTRQLQQLPEGASITSIKLTNLFTRQVAFSAEIATVSDPAAATAAASGATATSPAAAPAAPVAPATMKEKWTQALAGEAEERRNAVLALIEQLRDLRASSIVAPDFSTTVPGGAEPRPWTWLLEATISLEGGVNPETRQFSLFLDAYNGGTQLYAGSSDLKLVFTTEQSFIDAFAPLVFQRADPGPPPPGASQPGGSPTNGNATTSPAPASASAPDGTTTPPAPASATPATPAPAPTPAP